MSKRIHNKIKKRLKGEYGYEASEHENLSLYGFTNIYLLDNYIPIAILNTGTGLCLYRILDKIHYHHIEKLKRLMVVLNDKDYKYQLFTNKRTERVRDWYRKVHTEVYNRNL